MYYLIPLAMFLLIEFYFVIAFYQVFRHFPWNLGTTESMMFGWFSLLAFIFIAVAWSNLGSYNGGTTDVDDMHPDEQFDDWGIDIDWDTIDQEDQNR
jgi:hypothetical protein